VLTIGITNQRETTIAFDRSTGQPLANAIVWQDRRTADHCAELASLGLEPLVRRTTGLVLDPYFSATKMAWLLRHGVADTAGDLALSTIDAWVVWNLTGGTRGGAFVTDPSNASRTMLFDLALGTWSDDLAEQFGIPLPALPTIVPSAGRVGVVASPLAPSVEGVPISGIIGDQQGALFGQACFTPGMAKATYGTGSFVLQNIGTNLPEPPEGLTTSVAWQLGARAPLTFALEGSAFVAGAAIQWLRDELGLIARSEDLEPLARSVESSEGVMVVPAFTGLGSPWFDPNARGTIMGLSRGSGRPQIARATVEALSYQVTAMVDRMVASAAQPLAALRVDGGASAMSLLCQLQANQLGVTVERPTSVETTALGAAMVAAIGEDLLDQAELPWTASATFAPSAPLDEARLGYDQWLRAVERSRGLEFAN
jgi:glycerol kinase